MMWPACACISLAEHGTRVQLSIFLACVLNSLALFHAPRLILDGLCIWMLSEPMSGIDT